MRTTQIRQQLHDYIDSVEDKKLKAIYTVLEIADEHQLSLVQQEELDKRFSDYQNGVGKSFTWDETIAIAEKTLQERKNNR